MDIILTSNFHYSTSKPVSLAEVGQALQALDRIIQRSPAVLEALIPGLRIKQIRGYPLRISEGSLDEDIKLHVVAEIQQALQAKVESVGERLGIETLQKDSKLISWVLMALIVTGAITAYNAIFPTKEAYHIQGDNNTIFNIGGDITGLDPAQLRAIIDAQAGDRKSLSRDAVDVLRPAKASPGAGFRSGELELTPPAVAEVPFALPDLDDPEVEELFDVEGQIRASDLDSTKSGWRVLIPAISDQRIKMHVAPGIDLEELSTRKTFTGDVVVVRRRLPDGTLRPVLVLLNSVREEPR